MISLPPYILLVPFALFLLGFVFFAAANIFSLARYGARNAIGFLAILMFLAGVALILFLASRALSGIAWTTSVPVFELRPPSLF